MSGPINLSELNDAAFNDLVVDTQNESSRRSALRGLRNDFSSVIDKFVTWGGNLDDLQNIFLAKLEERDTVAVEAAETLNGSTELSFEVSLDTAEEATPESYDQD